MLIPRPLDLSSVLSRKLFSLQLLLLCKRLKRCLVPGYVKILMHEVKDKLKELFSILLLIDTPL